MKWYNMHQYTSTANHIHCKKRYIYVTEYKYHEYRQVQFYFFSVSQILNYHAYFQIFLVTLKFLLYWQIIQLHVIFFFLHRNGIISNKDFNINSNIFKHPYIMYNILLFKRINIELFYEFITSHQCRTGLLPVQRFLFLSF